jgi:hypothetical protein
MSKFLLALLVFLATLGLGLQPAGASHSDGVGPPMDFGAGHGETEIDALSWSWGETQQGTMSYSRGQRAARQHVQATFTEGEVVGNTAGVCGEVTQSSGPAAPPPGSGVGAKFVDGGKPPEERDAFSVVFLPRPIPPGHCFNLVDVFPVRFVVPGNFVVHDGDQPA